jgi:hypothetical protein
MDANLRRAKEFATGLDAAKAGMLDIGAKALGVVNGLGEWIGRQAAVIRYGEQQVAQGETIAKQTEATLLAIEKNKKATLEIVELRKQTNDLIKREREEQDKQLSASDRLIKSLREYQAALDVVNQQGMTKKQSAEAEFQLAEKKLALTKAQAEADKESSAERKKEYEQALKSEKEMTALRDKESQDEAKRHSKAFDDKAKLQFETLSGAEKEKVLMTELDAINKDLRAYKKDTLEYTEAEVAKLQKTKELTELRARAEPSVTEEKRKQVELVTEEVRKVLELARGFESLTVVGGRNTEQLSDRQLQDKIRNLQKQITDMQSQEFNRAGFALTGRDPTGLGSVLNAELERAQNEANLRSTVSQRVKAFGELGARATFQGKEDVFERILEKLGPTDAVTKTASGIEELNRRLEAAGFHPKR